MGGLSVTRLRPIGFVVAIAVVLVAGSFFAGRIVIGTPAAGDEDPVDVIAPGTTIGTPPGPEVTPLPGATPDMTKP